MSFLDTLKNRLVEMKDSVVQLKTEPAVAQKRIEICKACPDLSKSETCGHCGCYMPVKIHVAGAVCPIGKW